MRPSTRTSRRRLHRGLRRPGVVAAAALLLPLLGSPAPAVPITAEAQVRLEAGDLARARREALAASLTRAVEVVLRRHVPSRDYPPRAAELERAFLSRPTTYVLRYAVAGETLGEDFLRVEVEAEVDRPRILAELRGRGVATVLLAVSPRVLLVPLGSPESTPAANSLRAVFEREGLRTRIFPGGSQASADEVRVSEWARSLGCHVAVVVAAEAPALPSGDPAGEGPADLGPAGHATLEVVARGWVVDARSEEIFGRTEARALGSEPDLPRASALAAARVGRALAYPLLADLEQSGWRPGETLSILDLRVEGVPNPALIEGIQQELEALAEVRSAQLREVGQRTGLWRMEVLDSGVGWDSLLGVLRLPRGRLAWQGAEVPPGGGDPDRVRAVWVQP